MCVEYCHVEPFTLGDVCICVTNKARASLSIPLNDQTPAQFNEYLSIHVHITVVDLIGGNKFLALSLSFLNFYYFSTV